MKWILLLAVLFFVGCEEDDLNKSDKVLNAKQESMMQEANAQAGMPAITNFQERKLAKAILEKRDQADLLCYCYLECAMTGHLVYVGRCIGYGLPYATEYTSPQKPYSEYQRGLATLPQADPNGLFMPGSAEGTWVMLVGKDGNPQPAYFEQRVAVLPFKVEEVAQ